MFVHSAKSKFANFVCVLKSIPESPMSLQQTCTGELWIHLLDAQSQKLRDCPNFPYLPIITQTRNLSLFTLSRLAAKKCFEIFASLLSFYLHVRMDILVANTSHKELPRTAPIISCFHQPLGRSNKPKVEARTFQAQCTLHLTCVFQNVGLTCFPSLSFDGRTRQKWQGRSNRSDVNLLVTPLFVVYARDVKDNG